MTCLNKISKPHIVDLLRVFDKRKTITPRIRYASVRSKPELIGDILRPFTCTEKADVILFEPNVPLDAPLIEYNLSTRAYIFNGETVDVPKESREQPKFRILYGPFLVNFEHPSSPVRHEGQLYRPLEDHPLRGLLIATSPRASKTNSVSSGVSQGPGTRSFSSWTSTCAP